MTIYVDPIEYYAHAKTRNKLWCHLATDQNDLAELHEMAEKLGIRRYFQNKPGHPHYDLYPSKRVLAVSLGAVEVTSGELVDRCSLNLRRLRQAREVYPSMDKPGEDNGDTIS
jgi:hypothetical protein